MKSICFYFQVHQPFRLRTYRFFDIGKNHHYYDEYFNRMIMRRVAEKCYLPMNKLLLELIEQYGVKFKVSFSFSGLAMEQMEMYAPEVLESFKKLVKTGNVEILAETYAHSLSALKSTDEFRKQVQDHSDKVEQLFGVRPSSFRNTELIYSDEIGALVADMGYKVMLAEGAKHVLGWKSPNYMYANAINPKLKVLLRNYRLSDDITFRFSQQSWPEWPVTAEKFAGWLNDFPQNEEVVNIFMDYETFGEHQWASTGIFDFMKALPAAVFSTTKFGFSTPAELAKKLQPVSAVHVPNPISWADEERDLTAWIGNDLQDETYDKLYEYAGMVRHINDPDLLHDWYLLQSSDHFYYMCTKWFSDGDVHKYFNHYPSPYEAYINYMNVLSDFIIRLEQKASNAGLPFDELIAKGKQLGKEIGKATKAKVKQGIASSKPVFNDIKNLSDSKIKKLVKDVDMESLVIALRDAEEEIVERVIPNLNKSARKKYENLQTEIQRVKKTDINKVKKQIEEKLKELF
jgi:alpha-amylase